MPIPTAPTACATMWTDGLFITGTDTEVGKTATTALLARALVLAGQAPTAMKPMATGSAPPGEDALALARGAGHPPKVWRCWPTPVAPNRAARMAGATVPIHDCLRWIRRQPKPWMVEGVGGWRVPLAPGWDVSRLARTLALPVLVVSANRLGTLNHTLLTVEAVRASGLAVVGVVLNGGVAGASDASTTFGRGNLDDLRTQLPGVPVVPIPRIRPPDTDALARRLLSSLTGR